MMVIGLSLLFLSQLAIVALCAVNFSCEAIEEPRYGYQARVEVFSSTRNSSVLFYRLDDPAVAYTNIPKFIDQDVLDQAIGGFTVCSTKAYIAGNCSTLHEFVTDTKGQVGKTAVPITNMNLPLKTLLELEVHSHGIYCVAIYQDASEVEGVSVTIKHIYGGLTLTEVGLTTTYLWLLFFHLGLRVSLKYCSSMQRPKRGSVAREVIDNLLSFDLIVCVMQLYLLSLMLFDTECVMTFGDNGKYFHSRFTRSLIILFNLAEFLNVAFVIYCFSFNEQFRTKSLWAHYARDLGRMSFHDTLLRSFIDIGEEYYRSRLFTFLVTCHFASVVFFDLLNTLLIPVIISIPLKFITSRYTTSLLLILIYNINFNRTIGVMIDPNYIKKFRTSRIALVCITLCLTLTPLMFQILHSLGDIKDCVVTAGDPGWVSNLCDFIRRSFTIPLEQCISNEWLFILSNTRLFIVISYCCALIIIWRPTNPCGHYEIGSDEGADTFSLQTIVHHFLEGCSAESDIAPSEAVAEYSDADGVSHGIDNYELHTEGEDDDDNVGRENDRGGRGEEEEEEDEVEEEDDDDVDNDENGDEDENEFEDEFEDEFESEFEDDFEDEVEAKEELIRQMRHRKIN